MAKRRSQAQSGRNTGEAPLPNFAFDRFSFRNVVFSELEKAPLPDGEPPPKRTVKTSISARVGLSAERVAEVHLSVEVIPNPQVQPYEIRVEITGIFSTTDGTPDQLGVFCRTMGPTILFPFIRQMVSAVTSDARYGRVLLKPVNLLSKLGLENWTEEPPMAEAQ